VSSQNSALDGLRIDREAPRKSRIPVGWIVLALLCLALAGGAVGWWLTRPKPVDVRTVTVQASGGDGARTLLNGSGYVTPRREATVSSKLTGKVIEVLIEEGMKVEAGQILARVDDTNVRASLRLVEAQQEAARSALGETKARLVEAQKEYERVTALAADKISSPAEEDRARAELRSLEARLERQQVEVTVAERQVAVWQQQLEDTEIRAPFAGVVVAKNAQPGEMISPMSAGGFTRTGICTIVDMQSLEIEVEVNESFINRVQSGQPVEATLDSYPDWKIPAKVLAIIPTANRQNATVTVRVGFEKLDPRILPQMAVKVAFRAASEPTNATAAKIRVPKSAVQKDGERDVVHVMREGRVERRAVKLGEASAEEVVILAGLSGGEKVVIESPASLADGTRVTEAKR
jgi:HlyD family secretion protein